MDVKSRMGVFGRQLRQFGQAVKLVTRPKAQNSSTDTQKEQAGFKEAMRQSGRASKAQEKIISQGEKALKNDKEKLDPDMQRLNDAMGQHSSFDEAALEADLDKIQKNINK